MADNESKLNTTDERKKSIQPTDPDFDEAVDRVYQKYGSDLESFVRDVKKELQRKSEGNRRAAAACSNYGDAKFI